MASTGQNASGYALLVRIEKGRNIMYKYIIGPLSKGNSKERIKNNYTSMYFTMLSIIQGVTFGLLAYNTFNVINRPCNATPLLLILPYVSISWLTIVIIFYEYSWSLSLLYAPPNFREALNPFLLATLQILPMYYLDKPRYYWLLFSLLSCFGIIAYSNTIYNLKKNEPLTEEAFNNIIIISERELVYDGVLCFLITIVCLLAGWLYPNGVEATRYAGLKDYIPFAFVIVLLIIMIAKTQWWYMNRVMKSVGIIIEDSSCSRWKEFCNLLNCYRQELIRIHEWVKGSNGK